MENLNGRILKFEDNQFSLTAQEYQKIANCDDAQFARSVIAVRGAEVDGRIVVTFNHTADRSLNDKTMASLNRFLDECAKAGVSVPNGS